MSLILEDLMIASELPVDWTCLVILFCSSGFILLFLSLAFTPLLLISDSSQIQTLDDCWINISASWFVSSWGNATCNVEYLVETVRESLAQWKWQCHEDEVWLSCWIIPRECLSCKGDHTLFALSRDMDQLKLTGYCEPKKRKSEWVTNDQRLENDAQHD